MATMVRKVIKIDEDLCNGCGLCVPACAEGAIQIIDGKAKLVADKYCDGLGACLGDCPLDAISFEEREAEEFDLDAVKVHLESIGREFDEHAHQHMQESRPEPAPTVEQQAFTGCPGSRVMDFRQEEVDEEVGDSPKLRSELRQWPVKLALVNPAAPYLQGADLVLAADCSAFAYANFHPNYLKGKALVIGCPKFEDVGWATQKLQMMIEEADLKSITVVHMEVPCCTGLIHAAQEAILASGRNIPMGTVIVSIRGEVM